MRLIRQYEAEAAHQLSAGLPDGHPCMRLHGHRYEIEVTIIGDINPATGMLMEYGEIDSRVNTVLGFIDHRFINMLGHNVVLAGSTLVMKPLGGLNCVDLAAKVRENSTVENLAKWFISELRCHFNEPRHVGGLAAQVYMVRIKEDSRSSFEVGAGEV